MRDLIKIWSQSIFRSHSQHIVKSMSYIFWPKSFLRPNLKLHKKIGFEVSTYFPEVRRSELGGEAFLIRYNSRLPIVVYAREGVEVRYRIWSADHKTKKLEEG